MKYKLICLDIDGTLLTDSKELLPQTKKSLKEASDKGVRIALISGRMPAGVSLIEKELGIQCIKVCNAGTYILLGDRCISAKYLLPGIMKNIYLDIAKKNNLPLWIFQDRKWFVTDIDHYIEREIEIIRYTPEVVDAEELADQWEKEGKGPSKLLLAAEAEKIPEIYRKIEELGYDDIDMACSADTFLEIFPKGVTKGTALKDICEKLDIPLEETIAFGDHELDIPLIEAAGIGVAMGNSIQDLIDKADFVTKSNNEQGISYALGKYLS